MIKVWSEIKVWDFGLSWCLGRERWPMDHEVLLFLVLLSGTLCHWPYVHRPLHSNSFRVD